MASSKVDFEKVRAKLSEISAGFVKEEAKVGWFPGAVYPNGTPVAYVALIQEMGAPAAHIPPRPFIRPTVKAQRDVWAKILRDGAKAVIKGKFTAHQVLEGVGMQASGDIRKTITQITSPPLSPITMMLRKMKVEDPTLHVSGKTVGEAAAKIAAGEGYEGVSDKPLIEPGGGILLTSLTNHVERKG